MRWKPQLLRNLISEVASHYLGHNLLFRRESLNSAHTQRRGLHKEQKAEVIGGYFISCLPQLQKYISFNRKIWIYINHLPLLLTYLSLSPYYYVTRLNCPPRISSTYFMCMPLNYLSCLHDIFIMQFLFHKAFFSSLFLTSLLFP